MSKRIISFHYTLFGPEGEVIDSSEGMPPFAFLEGASQIIPGLEKALILLAAGDKRKVNVPAAEAYGARNESLVITVGRDKLPAQEIEVGDQFRGGKEPQSPVFVVIAVNGEQITLDGNHPLAGQDLTFDVEVTEVRDATAEEMQHGHPHGPGGEH